MEWQGRNAVVVGLGKSGIAAARLLLREKAQVAVVDDKPIDSLRAALGAVAALVDKVPIRHLQFTPDSRALAA